MGYSPKTKADCDRWISTAESNLLTAKTTYERVKAGYPVNYSKQAVADAKIKVEQAKAELAKYKALRKTLKE